MTLDKASVFPSREPAQEFVASHYYSANPPHEKGKFTLPNEHPMTVVFAPTRHGVVREACEGRERPKGDSDEVHTPPARRDVTQHSIST